jgi:heme-degrading monooxygenase HmoA
MILRSWHGVVPNRLGDAFEQYFRDVTVNEIKTLSGNLGAYFRREIQGAFTHVFLITYWDNWDSIRRFAGATPHIAVTYPDDLKYELLSDPIVLHQECSTIQPWYGEP